MPPYRQSLKLAVPLILSNLTVPLLGMVDTAVIGRLPDPHHLGSVALGAAVMSMLLLVSGALRIGTGGLTAQAFGSEDEEEIRTILLRAGSLALVASALFLISAPALMAAARWIFAPTPEISEGLNAYLAIRMFGLPATLLAHVANGWFLGQQRPLIPLTMMLVANGLNAALDVWFVLFLDMGVEGLAFATVIAEYTALAIACFFAHRTLQQSELAGPRFNQVMNPAAMKRILLLGRDLLLRTLIMNTVFLGFTALGARQGELILAANAVLMNFFLLQAHGLDGFADAAEAMTGRAVGRRSPSELLDAVRANFVNAGLLACAATLVFYVLGHLIIDSLTTIEDVRQTAYAYLPYITALPLVSVWAFVLDGVFFGATRARELRNAMILATLFCIAVAAILAPQFGNHGLWIAFLAYMGARGIILGLIYWRADRGASFALD